MGAWGVKSRESDSGLDYLGILERELFEKGDYAHFHVRGAMTLLENAILKEGLRFTQNDGRFWAEVEMCNCASRQDEARLLIAECLCDYLKQGCLVVDTFDPQQDYKPIPRRIEEFQYTQQDLASLFYSLSNIHAPSNDIYKSWKDTESFPKWEAHMESMSETIYRAYRELCKEADLSHGDSSVHNDNAGKKRNNTGRER